MSHGRKFRMTWTSLMLLVKIVTQGRRKTRKICILRSTRGKHSAPKNEKKIGQCFELVGPAVLIRWHTVSFQIFCSLSVSLVFFQAMSHNVEKNLSNHKVLEENTVISRNFFCHFLLKKKIIEIHGTKVHGSVFKTKFRFLIIEFESVETSQGFAWLLLENWG